MFQLCPLNLNDVVNYEVERKDREDIHQWVNNEPSSEESIVNRLEINKPVDYTTNRND